MSSLFLKKYLKVFNHSQISLVDQSVQQLYEYLYIVYRFQLWKLYIYLWQRLINILPTPLTLRNSEKYSHWIIQTHKLLLLCQLLPKQLLFQSPLNV